MEGASTHIGGSPTTLRFPGMQVKPLFPSRSTVILPFASVSTILGAFATSVGPADIARAILTCVEPAPTLRPPYLCLSVEAPLPHLDRCADSNMVTFLLNPPKRGQ